MIWVIIVVIGLVIFFSIKSRDETKNKPNAMKSFYPIQVENKDYDIVITLSELMEINNVASILEKESKEKGNHSSDRQAYNNALNIFNVYSSPLLQAAMPKTKHELELSKLMLKDSSNIIEELENMYSNKNESSEIEAKNIETKREIYLNNKIRTKEDLSNLLTLFIFIIKGNYSLLQIRRLINKWIYEIQTDVMSEKQTPSDSLELSSQVPLEILKNKMMDIMFNGKNTSENINDITNDIFKKALRESNKNVKLEDITNITQIIQKPEFINFEPIYSSLKNTITKSGYMSNNFQFDDKSKTVENILNQLTNLTTSEINKL